MKAFHSAIGMVLLACISLPVGEGLSLADEWELDEVVVKEERSHETQRIEGEKLRETGGVDLGEALENEEGFWKVRKGGIANDIQFRGFQKNNLNVLIDGARIHGACPNRMDPSAFFVDLGETDRVEIYKGPFDLRHQGSMGGLVNIRTASAPEGWHGRGNVGYGSFNRVDTSIQGSYGSDGLGGLLGGTFQYSEPYKDGSGRRFTEIYPENSPNRYRPSERKGKAYLVGDGWGKFRMAPFKDHEVELTYGRHEASDVLYPYLLMDLISDSSDLVNAVYRVDNLGEVLNSLRFQAYWDDVGHDMTDEKRCSSQANPGACGRSLPKPFSMQTWAFTETVGATLEGLFTPFGKTRVGVEYYLSNWNATTTMFNAMAAAYRSQASMPNVDSMNIGGYLEHDHNLIDNLRLTAGVRLDYTEQTPGADRSSFYRMYFPGAPKSAADLYVSGNVQFTWLADENLSVFLGYGHTVSVPDPSDRWIALQRMGTPDKADRVGNPSLVPSENNEVDVGAEYGVDRFRLRADLYWSRVDDFIVVRDVISSGGRFGRVSENVDASLYGGEGSVLLRLPWNLYATGGLAYTRGWNETEGTDLPEIPPLMGRAGLGYNDGTFFGEFEGVFSDAQTKVDSLIDESMTPSWGVANLRLGYTWKWLRVFANLENLFDKNYVEHLSYQRDPFRSGIRVPEPGRTFYIGVQAEI